MEEKRTIQDPVINCHTHVFIGESVPPYFGKTFLPLGLHRVLTIPLILAICRFWYTDPRAPRQWRHQFWYKKWQRIIYKYRWFMNQNGVLRGITSVINIVISLHAALFLALWLISIYKGADTTTADMVEKLRAQLSDRRLIWLPTENWIRVLVILFTVICIRNGRRLIFYLGTKLVGIAGMIPSKKTLQYLGRYLNIGRFAYYKRSKDIYDKLERQYEPGTGFVLLPMDMEFIDAGNVKGNGVFARQMQELADIKKANPGTAFPFVFADPRRSMVGDTPFLRWSQEEGKVLLGDCFIREYIEGKGFNGFKIYPALGYYPFDERLLPLWKYAADRQLPILTHCIRGTVFYRGDKAKEWGWHPVFTQSGPAPEPGSLLLPEIKNEDFCNNFGHPLNYLCLLDERLLRKVVNQASPEVQALFGYRGEAVPMERDLRDLKLCFGHYGGDDEWRKYFEKDRDRFNSQLKTDPDTGIRFIKGEDIRESTGVLEQVWKHVDWYSIISSIMLQYENVYADISYIIHDNEIVPLLKHTVQHAKLKHRVLFGTDFYVVRNHKSEKQMLAELVANLGKEDFDQIARVNPRSFLQVK